MSVAQRVLTGLAVAICLAVGSVMVRSPTGLEKTPGSEPAAFPRIPSEADWLTLGEDELVGMVVGDPVKVRGLRSFAPEHQVELKELMRRTEELVRSTARSARSAGHLDRQERETVERAIAQYAAELERFSVLR